MQENTYTTVQWIKLCVCTGAHTHTHTVVRTTLPCTDLMSHSSLLPSLSEANSTTNSSALSKPKLLPRHDELILLPRSQETKKCAENHQEFLPEWSKVWNFMLTSVSEQLLEQSAWLQRCKNIISVKEVIIYLFIVGVLQSAVNQHWRGATAMSPSPFVLFSSYIAVNNFSGCCCTWALFEPWSEILIYFSVSVFTKPNLMTRCCEDVKRLRLFFFFFFFLFTKYKSVQLAKNVIGPMAQSKKN